MSALPSTTATPQAPPLAAAQHKAALWADAGQAVYAVVMGTRVPGLPARLAAAGAEVVDHDCLLPGALAPAQQQAAPYLVQLQRDSAFTDWLLFEAAAALGDWGLLVRSPARLLALRNHLRQWLQARLPTGETIALDWMDPPVLQALLPHFASGALAAFFGPVQALTVPGPRAWHHAELALGALQQRDVPVAAGA